jgi:hypothetical protein
MKYMQNGGFQNHPLMRLTLVWSLIFLAGLWLTNFFMYFSRMSLLPQSVADYYRGSETLFTQPRSLPSMLEVTHMHLPMMAIVVLLLTHLLIFAPFTHRAKVVLIGVSFGSALLQEAAGWLVRFAHPGFSLLKILSFLAFQAMLGFLLSALALYLWRAADEPPRHGRQARRRAGDASLV